MLRFTNLHHATRRALQLEPLRRALTARASIVACSAIAALILAASASAATVEVTPSTGVDPAGDSLAVSGGGWASSGAVNLALCVQGDPRLNNNRCYGSVAVPTDAAGDFSSSYAVTWQQFDGTACRAPYCKLRVTDNSTGTPLVFTPVEFAVGTADLKVTHSAAPNPAVIGDQATFTVDIANNGPNTATAVTLKDSLPANGSYVSASGATCIASNGVLACGVDDVAPGDTATVKIVVTADSGSGLVSFATVTARENEVDGSDNSFIQAFTNTRAASADLSAALTASPDPVPSSGALTYTMTIANDGPDTATGVSGALTLPAGTSFDSASTGCVEASGVVTCDVDDLSSGRSSQATVHVHAPASGPLHGTVDVTGTRSDPMPSNNHAAASTIVLPPNRAPACNDVIRTTYEDTAVDTAPSCTDADGDALTYSIVSGPSHGSLTGSGGGRTYTPAANYHGPDSFTYRASDGSANSSTATVSLTVTAVNDAPVCTDGSGSTTSGAALATPLSCDDVDADALTYAVVSGPSHGTLTGTGASRTYTSAAGYSGPDSFTYTANDGSLSSTAATMSLTVTAPPPPPNKPPVAVSDSYSVAPGQTLNIAAPGVLANDSDPDGPRPTVARVKLIDFAASEYSWAGNGGFTLIVGAGTTVGTQKTITYVAVDSAGAESALARISITVQPDPSSGVVPRPRSKIPFTGDLQAGVTRVWGPNGRYTLRARMDQSIAGLGVGSGSIAGLSQATTNVTVNTLCVEVYYALQTAVRVATSLRPVLNYEVPRRGNVNNPISMEIDHYLTTAQVNAQGLATSNTYWFRGAMCGSNRSNIGWTPGSNGYPALIWSGSPNPVVKITGWTYAWVGNLSVFASDSAP